MQSECLCLGFRGGMDALWLNLLVSFILVSLVFDPAGLSLVSMLSQQLFCMRWFNGAVLLTMQCVPFRNWESVTGQSHPDLITPWISNPLLPAGQAET